MRTFILQNTHTNTDTGIVTGEDAYSTQSKTLIG